MDSAWGVYGIAVISQLHDPTVCVYSVILRTFATGQPIRDAEKWARHGTAFPQVSAVSFHVQDLSDRLKLRTLQQSDLALHVKFVMMYVSECESLLEPDVAGWDCRRGDPERLELSMQEMV